MLPSITLLKTITEKLKQFSNYVTVSANMNGEFRLSVESEHGDAESYFDELLNPELGN